MSSIGSCLVESEDKAEWHDDWDSYWEHITEYPEDGRNEVEMFYGDSVEQSCILN